LNRKLKCTFRDAVENDIDIIYSIEEEASSLWKINYFNDELEINFSTFIVAEFKNEIIGFAVAWYVFSEIQLNNIAVKKEYRRSGIGTAMLNYIINSLEPAGIRKIFLEIKKSNNIAKSFYQNCGFIETGIRKKYYQIEDAILMEKELVT